MLNLSRFVAIIKVISESRASVVKDSTEWLVRCHITSVLDCTTYAVYQQRLSWLGNSLHLFLGMP